MWPIHNPLSEARDRNSNLMVPSQICFCCTMTGTPIIILPNTPYCTTLMEASCHQQGWGRTDPCTGWARRGRVAEQGVINGGRRHPGAQHLARWSWHCQAPTKSHRVYAQPWRTLLEQTGLATTVARGVSEAWILGTHSGHSCLWWGGAQ